MKIPHWAPPTHAMQIWRFAEQGSINLLWISATNPAVSLPELPRIRNILEQDDLFVVVQDLFLTETARYADVVLPAATWGEKTGTFTNADRTVHLSEKAVEPPGEARPDLDIFLDYARRMDFRDLDDEPLIKWAGPEEAFEAWKECSRGRPSDYTGLTYEKLRGGSGIQWPCNAEHPEGTERLYTDGVFNTQTDYCERYGTDLNTGAANTRADHLLLNPAGRAIILPTNYEAPVEPPGEEYPFLYTTGRTIYQFHTRTKTGRAKQLRDAAPEPWVERLADAFRQVGEGHAQEVDVYHICHSLARQCEAHAEKMSPFIDRYGEQRPEEPERLHSELFSGVRAGGLGLLRDLQDLFIMGSECEISWTMIGQAAQGADDEELLEVVDSCTPETSVQLKWINTRMKQAAPQALLVAS